MSRKKTRVFPVVIVAIMIVIIFYLVATAKQPYVECSRKSTDELGITIRENLKTSLDSNKISKMTLTKTIIFPDKYLEDDKYLEAFKFALEKSYAYLDEDSVKVTKGDNYLVVTVNALSNETIILNNIEFYDNDGLKIKINPNTKSSDVVTLSINDKYTEGELMTHLKNNGYVCK